MPVAGDDGVLVTPARLAGDVEVGNCWVVGVQMADGEGMGAEEGLLAGPGYAAAVWMALDSGAGTIALIASVSTG